MYGVTPPARMITARIVIRISYEPSYDNSGSDGDYSDNNDYSGGDSGGDHSGGDSGEEAAATPPAAITPAAERASGGASPAETMAEHTIPRHNKGNIP